MIQSGVDTVSLAFRPRVDRPLDAFRQTPHRGGASGSLVCDERGPDGGRLLCWPGHGLLAYETRLGALLAGDADNHDLVPASALRLATASARMVAHDLIGADVGDQSEVRRFDLAAELRFGTDGRQGLAFLSSLRGICPPRARATLEVAADGQVMTAYVRTEKRGVVLSRTYDKGRESGSDPPGVRIRIESQNRPPKSKRYRPDVLATRDLSATFGRTMSHYLTADTVVAAGPDAAVTHLMAQAARGEISTVRAERLVGSIAFIRAAGRGAYHDPDSTAKENNRRSARRLKSLRDAGIALEHELPVGASVPTSELLRTAIAEFTS